MSSQVWRLASGRALTLDRPRLIAILNVTPDSFHDGGLYAAPEAALRRAMQCLEEGADVIDLGGESTRPGAAPVAPDEQIRRTLPVITSILRERPETLISIDTTSAAVAAAALDAGAVIVNDTSAARDDAGMAALVAERGAGVIIMHRLKRPAADQFSTEYEAHAEPRYGDVGQEIRAFLLDRAQHLKDAGCQKESIVLDPGIGFGKTVAQNWTLVRRLPEFQAGGFTALSALSRKSFLGGLDPARPPIAPSERLPATLAASISNLANGIRLFRVHDVAAHRTAFDAAIAAGLAAPPAGSP